MCRREPQHGKCAIERTKCGSVFPLNGANAIQSLENLLEFDRYPKLLQALAAIVVGRVDLADFRAAERTRQRVVEEKLDDLFRFAVGDLSRQDAMILPNGRQLVTFGRFLIFFRLLQQVVQGAFRDAARNLQTQFPGLFELLSLSKRKPRHANARSPGRLDVRSSATS